MFEPSTDAISISENDQKRSDIVCKLVQSNEKSCKFRSELKGNIPKIIVQYWDDPNHIPPDVEECIKTWDHLDSINCDHVLFNDYSARNFIAAKLNQRNVEAYDRCYHPAMKSDYFRLCFMLSHGGCYIDTDDTYCGTNIQHFFSDLRLKLQPLCFDVSTNEMVEPEIFTKIGQYSHNWIFYFNNNPIVASQGDPIIRYALRRATTLLLELDHKDLPEIQSTTGPGNLTASLIAHLATPNSYKVEDRLLVLSDWKNYARTIWPLSYRNDKRNWRLSNRQRLT